jgi:outer membrane biosynthesis protein TonB
VPFLSGSSFFAEVSMIRRVLAVWLSLVLVVGLALTSPGAPAMAQAKPESQKPTDEPKKPDEPKKDEPKKDEPKKPEEPKKAEAPRVAPEGPRPGGPQRKSAAQGKVRPYDEIVTAETKSKGGLFMVHRLEEKILYEIPVEALGKEMLWVTQIEKTGARTGYGGSPAGDRVIRWEQGRRAGQFGRANHRRLACQSLWQGQGSGHRRD